MIQLKLRQFLEFVCKTATAFAVFILFSVFPVSNLFAAKNAIPNCGFDISENKHLQFTQAILTVNSISCIWDEAAFDEEDDDESKSHYFTGTSFSYIVSKIIFLSAKANYHFAGVPESEIIPLYILFHSWKSFLV